jgi:Subtilase family/Domain of unknown function (DUF4382)
MTSRQGAELGHTWVRGTLDATSTRVDVLHRSDCNDGSTESVRTVSTSALTIHFVAGASTARRLVAKLNVSPGCIEQVRFIMHSMTVTIGGQALPVKMPSGQQTGIKIVPDSGEPPFPILTDQTTTILTDYDPNEKIVLNKGQGAIEKPVLEARVIPNESGEASTGFINDEVIATFDPSTSDAYIGGVLGFVCSYFKDGFADPRNYYTLKLVNSADLFDAITCLTNAGAVAALPNTLVALEGPNGFTGNPSDPLYQDAPPAGYEALDLQTVKAPDAWQVTTGGDVVAAVVDNGFDLLHADLMDNIWINQDEIPAAVKSKIQHVDPTTASAITFVDLNDPQNNDPTICKKDNSPPNNICDPLDLADGKKTVGYGWQDNADNNNPKNGKNDDFFGWDYDAPNGGDNLPEPNPKSTLPYHGTGVAGIMAGLGNNGVAGPGVAWHARVMLVKGVIAPPSGDPSLPVGDRLKRDSVVRGLRYARQNSAQIINLSQGNAILRADVDVFPECNAVHEVPASKFKAGVVGLAKEWATNVASAGDGLVIVAMPNCAGLNADQDGVFVWPAFTRPRPELGVSFADPGMLAVTSVDPSQTGAGNTPILAGCVSLGPDTVQIGAPGTNFHILDVQPYPPQGMSSGTTDCPPSPGHTRPPSCPNFCNGTSLAAPMVAGAGILVLANSPSLTPLDVKGRLLDNATLDVAVGNSIEGSRLLNVSAAVGP